MKKEKEFNLSEECVKLKHLTDVDEDGNLVLLLLNDVKEFIKRVKEELCQEAIDGRTRESSWERRHQQTIIEVIDKYAGEKLR